MAKLRICPYCFEEFNASEIMFRCGNTKCKNENDPVLAKFWGDMRRALPSFPGKKTGLFGTGIPESGICPECGQSSSNMICPHCHNRIPKEMVENKGYIISIIGARSSGKTNYITVLIDQLSKQLSKLGGLAIMASAVADEPKYRTSVRYNEDFYNILYRNKTCPAQTQIGDEKNRVPLIYRLTSANKKAPTVHLVFYDTAGENFNDPQNIKDNVKFINKSDAFIFLLDTFQIRYVKDKLGLPDEQGDLKYDAILENIVSHFIEGDKSEKKAHFAKPMALTFSKIDAIISQPELFEDTAIPGMSMQQNSPFLDGHGLSLKDIDSVSDGIAQALNLWGESDFRQNIANNYKNYKFFGISALGQKPNADNEIERISPYRVLDPIIWILHELKYPMLIRE